MTEARRKNVHEIERERVSRNAPCPCGSGKHYKKCCLLIKENAVRLRVTLNRGIKAKILEIYEECYKGKTSKEQFLREIKVTNPEEGEWLYTYCPIIVGLVRADLILVRFEDQKTIVEELKRNGKTYKERSQTTENAG